MALCGELTIGVDSNEPNTPPLVMVNVPPVNSSMVMVPARARPAKLAMDFSTSAKLYSVTPEYDGQRLWVKIKAKVPMTLAILPSKAADQAFDKPDTLSSVLAQTSCKQRGVQSMEFECKVNREDGPQSLIAMPESPVRSRKKAEIEFQTLKCIANCDLIESETAANK